MSLLAGFDMVIEISNETILKLLQNNLRIAGTPLQPPFEVTVPVASGGLSGFAHMIITNILLDLNADDTVTLSLLFDRGSVVATSPVSKAVCPLDGFIALRTPPIKLVNAGGPNVAVKVNIPSATVTLGFSAGANKEIAKDLAGTGITPQQFDLLLVKALAGYLQSVPAHPLPLGFSVVPGANGSLTPKLVFERLEAHCIPNAKRNLQALAFFGILLAANNANGDHTQKTGTAITAATDGIAVSLSPQALHTLSFCPGVASALQVSIAKLPTSCGAAPGVDIQGVTLTSVVDTFGNGHIDIIGTAQKSGFCYDAFASFHATLFLTVTAGGKLNPSIILDEPEIDVDIPWYCFLAVGVILGPIGASIATAVDVIANAVAPIIATTAIKNALGAGLPGLGFGLPVGF